MMKMSFVKSMSTSGSITFGMKTDDGVREVDGIDGLGLDHLTLDDHLPGRRLTQSLRLMGVMDEGELPRLGVKV
jgi:hypothetical protein